MSNNLENKKAQAPESVENPTNLTIQEWQKEIELVAKDLAYIGLEFELSTTEEGSPQLEIEALHNVKFHVVCTYLKGGTRHFTDTTKLTLSLNQVSHFYLAVPKDDGGSNVVTVDPEARQQVKDAEPSIKPYLEKLADKIGYRRALAQVEYLPEITELDNQRRKFADQLIEDGFLPIEALRKARNFIPKVWERSSFPNYHEYASIERLPDGLRIYAEMLMNDGYRVADALQQARALRKINKLPADILSEADELLERGLLPTQILEELD